MPPVRRLAAAAAALIAALAAVTFRSATAGATAASYVNPVAGHPWGIYTGNSDGLWPAYETATGTNRTLLAKEALRPRVRRYTDYIPTADIADKISTDIADEQHGNPNVLVWMATFRLWPETEANKAVPLTAADQAAYKGWVDAAARGIGTSRVALVLEPDLPVSLTGWRPSVRLSLARYAAQRFAALPRTTVYLDAGSADWLPVDRAVTMLKAAGIGYVHGFALGSTHHDPTAAEIAYGRQVAIGLARAGFAGKHFVVDTSDNAHGYTNGQFYAKYPNGSTEAPPACKTRAERVCVSLGIPPTTDTADAAWQLPAGLRAAARRRCDAFVWDGHPWKTDNDRLFDLEHALDAARTSPWA